MPGDESQYNRGEEENSARTVRTSASPRGAGVSFRSQALAASAPRCSDTAPPRENRTLGDAIDRQECMTRPCWWQVWLGVAVLGFGVLVYVVDRPPGLTALPESITLFQPTVKSFGAMGQSLPAFAHVFAFSLLTMALLGGGRRAAIVVCSGWFFVNAAFELGQHSTIATKLAHLTPSWFEAIPILHRTDAFFLYGTFDPLDLLSIALGAFAAYVVMHRTQLRRTTHD